MTNRAAVSMGVGPAVFMLRALDDKSRCRVNGLGSHKRTERGDKCLVTMISRRRNSSRLKLLEMKNPTREAT